MIVLDTNVVSELSREEPNSDVLSWLDAQTAEIVTTAVTAAELLYGVARLPDGRRKTRLAQAVHGVLDEDLEGRVEPFDRVSAIHYAHIVTAREHAGRPISVADAQIAAVCRRLGAVLATRNTRDFEGAGIGLVNPWTRS